MKPVTIFEATHPNQKAEIVEEILTDLPDWFGLPESTKAYIEEARALPLFAASIADDIVGFITLRETSADTAEIHAMGVKKSFHRSGIGAKLFQAFKEYAGKDYTYLQVKTVDEGHYDAYDQTISFYKKMGFVKLEVFPDMWDAWNPCLILIQKIKK